MRSKHRVGLLLGIESVKRHIYIYIIMMERILTDSSMVMMGTSPTAFHHSNSFQSSSYLPKMEANILKDFYCCGVRHETMHDFTAHVEEAHPDQLTQGYDRAFMFASPVGFGRQPGQGGGIPRSSVSGAFGGITRLAPIQDMAAFEDMEMDDGTTNAPLQQLQAQGFRTSAPTTPGGTQNFNLFRSNPTVSSVNTPTLSTRHVQNQLDQLGNDLTFDPSNLSMFPGDGFDGINMDMGFDMGIDMPDMSNMTIHDPAKRLSSRNGDGTVSSAHLQFVANNNAQLDPEFQKALQQQQIAAGIPAAAVMGFPGEAEKKYRCPVIGCEKAYKNQNGLKYHKTVRISHPLF